MNSFTCTVQPRDKGSGNINSLFLWLLMCDLFGEILMIFDGEVL